ncbi:hypothetical protein GOP47_0002178 [Adiantum capillus-veneris]|uniref:PGG domain-containing protein n=1 Tax=Adiantum capillus-veneris TaxID=13818 RepID=A0A9D4ZRD6_ADICA|nr:hypothetical protein GOP47_0002178 [Adiantum capillus-veneris]
MEDSDHPQSSRTSSDFDPSVGSSASCLRMLKSMLPEDLQNWIPKEILSIPCKLSAANKELLLRKYGITELHWASLTRSMADAGDLLNKGVDVHKTTLRVIRRPSARDSKEIQGVTPLFIAARSGHAALVEVLLEHGAVEDILKAGTKGDTALHAAALSGDVGVMKLLLDALAATPHGSRAVDERGYNSRTSLHYAAGGGQPAIVSALLQAGADVYARDKCGATPLHFAAGWGNSIPCMDLLFGSSKKRHVDQARDNKGWTALHYAAANGQLQTVQWLLDQGADINAVENSHGNSSLHLAARHPEIIYALTSARADIWLENKNEEDAIGMAHSHKDAMAVRAHMKAIKMELHREDVDPFEKHGKDGATLLHYVSAYGGTEEMGWIVGLSAFQEEITAETSTGEFKVNITDNAGRTAVHWAAIAGNVEALRMLAKHKADLNVADDEGRSVLCLAIAHSKADMDFVHAFLSIPSVKLQIQRLITHDEAAQWMKEYYFVHNLQSVMVTKIKKLRRRRAILKHHVVESFQWVAGLFTVRRNQHNHVRRFNRTATMAFKEARQTSRNASGYNILDDLPPVYLALHADREDIANFMQEHIKGSAWQDAVVNRRGEETQRTALHWATILGESEIVSKLCMSLMFSKDLKPNVEDKYGKTPLQYAKEMNHAAIEKQLMERKDVKNHLEGLYRDRQVYVDAANAVLVAAALIASVTFAGWLQPPLNYVTYYDMPIASATDGAYEAYAAVRQHVGVRVFWGFNSLSFTFAIATVLAGLVGVVPIPNRYIATTVVHLRRTLWVASAMLALSIVFVLGAFAAAGFTVLPPIFEYRVNMLGTFVLGGVPCVLLLGWFVGILSIARQRTPADSLFSPPPPPPPPRPPLPSSARPWESDDPMTWSYIP